MVSINSAYSAYSSSAVINPQGADRQTGAQVRRAGDADLPVVSNAVEKVGNGETIEGSGGAQNSSLTNQVVATSADNAQSSALPRQNQVARYATSDRQNQPVSQYQSTQQLLQRAELDDAFRVDIFA